MSTIKHDQSQLYSYNDIILLILTPLFFLAEKIDRCNYYENLGLCDRNEKPKPLEKVTGGMRTANNKQFYYGISS